jgi:GTP-binding protein HflX
VRAPAASGGSRGDAAPRAARSGHADRRGKVEEIAGVAASTEADLVLFDHDLTPTQLRNLEAALPCRVIDRTQLILDIFARHARTREGQLQVELAQLEYMLPRLAGKGKAMSQLGGGIGTRGPGETSLRPTGARSALRIDHVKGELEAVRRSAAAAAAARGGSGADGGAGGLHQRRQEHALQRAHRRGVLESSRMFATLDPKLRSCSCPAGARFCCRTRWDSSATCRTRW